MGAPVETIGLEAALERLRAGGTLGFPTETVFGLGAGARIPSAVERVYAIKGRPKAKPMPVLVADLAMAETVASKISGRARALAEAFWPGPLTIVCPAHGSIRGIVTAGGDTVALRAPGLPLLLDLIRGFGEPVIAPSANRSGGDPAETLQEFASTFAPELAGGELACYCPDPAARAGSEPSTIVIPGDSPGRDTIIRPGPISAETLASVEDS